MSVASWFILIVVVLAIAAAPIALLIAVFNGLEE